MKHRTPIKELFTDAMTSNGDWYDATLGIETILDEIIQTTPELLETELGETDQQEPRNLDPTL